MPILVVIGGPNGSGKTTLTSYLKAKGRIKTGVINPDEIAINQFGSYSYQIKAAKIALQERKYSIANKNDFAFETTFSGNSELGDILKAKSLGYQIVLYYVSLPSVIDNINRIRERETNLGHKVDLPDTIRRYEKSKHNLLKYIDLFDSAYLFDNSGSDRSRVAIFKNGKMLWINFKHKNHPFFTELLK